LERRPSSAKARAFSCFPGLLAMTDLPDRLCVDPDSPFHDADLLAKGVGVRFKGEEKTNVEEYCISEGWVRLAVGNRVDRRGKALTVKLQGPVEAWIKGEQV
jgi:hypothetical protein